MLNSQPADTTISLLTCYPGGDVYELEGHTALRVQMPDGTDITVNYGLFDFNSPNFIYRFVKGETDYRCGAVPTQYFLQSYASAGRKVVEQTMDLTPAEAARAVEALSVNLLPENATYRYNYVKDNCATRPLAVISGAIDGGISFADTPANGSTFRNQMRGFHANYPWYQFGIDLALGSGIDYQLTGSEEAFAPMNLMQMMQKATRTDSLGRTVPVVKASTVLVDGPENGMAQGPTPAMLTPCAASVAVLLLAIAATWRQLRGGRIFPRLFDTLFFGAQGLAGLLLTFLIFVSVHEATSPNLLYMWLNPLALAGATFVWLKCFKKALLCYHFINFVLLTAMALLWWWQPQSGNPAFIPLIAASALRSGCYICVDWFMPCRRQHKGV